MSRIADVFRRLHSQAGPSGVVDGSKPEDASTTGEDAPPPSPWSLEGADTCHVYEGAVPLPGSDGGGRSLPPPSGRDGWRGAGDIERKRQGSVPAGRRRSNEERGRPPLRDQIDVMSYRDAVPRSASTDSGRDLLRYWDIACRRWRLGVLIALVVGGGVSAGVLLQTPVYRATGLLEMRPEAASAVPIEALFSPERVGSDELETQYGILKSATLAERVASQVLPEARPQDAETRREAVKAFRDALIVNPIRGSRLVEIGFTGPDPVFGAQVVNSFFDNYLHLRMEEAKRSASWLEGQLNEAQQRLESSEQRLHAFVQTHGLEVLETGKGETADLVNDRLQSLHTALAAARSERIEKQSRTEQVQTQSTKGELDSPLAQNLSLRLADLRREHAKLASTFHDEYPAVKALNSQIAELEGALARESSVLVGRVQADYQAALRREALLQAALERQYAAVQTLGQQSAGSAGYAALKRDVVTNQQQFAVLNQKLKEVSISAALKATNVGIVDRATPPTKPYGASPLTGVALAVIVGLMLAVGGMLLREHLDTSVRSAQDVDSYLGVPALAAIPAAGPELLLRSGSPAAERADPDALAGHHAPSALEEAFAALRTAVLLRNDSAARHTLLITSAREKEGKTTVCINLARSLARLKHRVLLIDANMRSPSVREALGLSEGPSLVSYLTTKVEWRACVHANVQPNLDVMFAGVPPTSPADLLSDPRMGELVAAASRDYEFVLLDSPAALAHPADVQSLAALAGSALLTVRQGATPREVVAEALAQLPCVSGVVLNGSEVRAVTRDGRVWTEVA